MFKLFPIADKISLVVTPNRGNLALAIINQ
uniref:Uncharacterized protein n=1 Tax=Rhizophora mucronata TaxID=61149 RepID=A0A2P2Q8B9_RHIMU